MPVKPNNKDGVDGRPKLGDLDSLASLQAHNSFARHIETGLEYQVMILKTFSVPKLAAFPF